MRKVITYGTFDLLHYGHINLLRRARELGDYLIVALSTDEFNWNEKRKKCFFTYEQRKQLLEAIRYVDLVIPEESWEQKISDVKEFRVDTFVIGDDWEGKFDFLKEYCEVVYLPRTPEISTTQIKTMADEVEAVLEARGENPLHREGYRSGGWVLIDFGCVVVHIFMDEARQFYNLERLWANAEEIAIDSIVMPE